MAPGHFSMGPMAAFFGLKGPMITEPERWFFREADPLGFILFARNIDHPVQVKTLVSELKELVGRDDVLILIDQEGGRVQRLKPPIWRQFPAAAKFAQLAAREPSVGEEALFLATRLIAQDLQHLGINVDCLPVLDVPQKDSHNVIGDRALGDDPDSVARLGKIQCQALRAGGVLPVIKHIPGHGRALVDSHFDLPRVQVGLDQLEQVDFAPFRALAGESLAMTAHVVFEAIDPHHPATLSPKVINTIIRQYIGFDGLLMGDDLSMKALGGSFASRTRDSLAAGCDMVLHCNGDMLEMQEVAANCPRLSGPSLARANRIFDNMPKPEAFDRPAALKRLRQVMEPGLWL